MTARVSMLLKSLTARVSMLLKSLTARVSMLLKSRTSLTCYLACFLPGRAKHLSAPRYN